MTSNATATALATAYIEAYNRATVWNGLPAAPGGMFHVAVEDMIILEGALCAEGYAFDEEAEGFILVPVPEASKRKMRTILSDYEGASWEERARAYRAYILSNDEGEWRYCMECAEAEACGGLY